MSKTYNAIKCSVVLADGEVRLQDDAGGEYVGIKAPSTVSASYAVTMPPAVGSNGQFLTTDASGILSWSSSATGLLTDGGDTTGSAVVVGTNDSNSLILESGGTSVVEVDTGGNFNLLTQSPLRLQDTTGGQYVGIRAPGTVTTSYTVTMPPAVGTNGQFLTTDISGNLSWASTATGLISDGGNSTGSAVVIGTNDSNSLFLEAGSTSAVELDTSGDLNLLTENAIKFQDTTGGQYVGMKAPATVSASYTLTMPSAAGTNGQFLTTDASSNLSWSSSASGLVSDGGNTTAADVVIGTNDANSLILETGGINAVELDTSGDLNLLTENAIKFQDTTGGQYVGMKAPATVSASYTLTMPPAVGTNGQFLTTTAAGVLSWSSSASGLVSDGGNTTAADVVIGTNDANSLILETGGTNAVELDTSGDLNLLTENAIKFQDTTGGEYVGMKAPATVSASYTLTMPTAQGTTGQFLSNSDGAGTMTWASSTTGNLSDGGNTTGAIVVSGTNDTFDFELETDGTTRMIVEAGGNIQVENALKLGVITETTTTATNTKNISFLDTIVSGGSDPVFSLSGRWTCPYYLDIFDCAIDSGGNIWVVGSHNSNGGADVTVPDLGAVAGSETSTNSIVIPGVATGSYLVVKYSSAGVALIAGTLAINNQPNKAYGIAIEPGTDNVYICGTFSATNGVFIKDMDTVGGTTSTNSVDFPSITSPGCFIIKMNNAGVIQTACKIFSHNNADGEAQRMAFDSAGDLWVTGHVQSGSQTFLNDFSTTGGSATAVDYGTAALHGPFIIKYSSDSPVLCAQVISSISMGSTGVHSAFALSIDSNDNVYASWRDRSNTTSFFKDMDTSSGSASSVVSPNTSSNFATILVKYNVSGVVQGATYIDNAPQGCYMFDIAIDGSDNVYVAGVLYSSSTFTVRNIDATSSASSITVPGVSAQRGFVFKYNSSGVAQSSSAVSQASGTSSIRSIVVDSSDDVHIVGSKTSTTVAISLYDFDGVGGTGADITMPTSLFSTFFSKFTSAGVLESAGRFESSQEPWTVSSLPSMKMAISGSTIVYTSGHRTGGTPNFYDYNATGDSSTTTVDVGASSGSITNGLIAIINPGVGSTSDAFKLISSLAAGDAGLVKTFSNNDVNTKTINIRNAADDTTLSSVDFTDEVEFIWTGTAWRQKSVSQAAGSGGDIANGGNTTGAAVVVGTNDAYNLELEANGSTALTVESGGDVLVANTLKLSAITETTETTTNNKQISFLETIITGGGSDPTFTKAARFLCQSFLELHDAAVDSAGNVFMVGAYQCASTVPIPDLTVTAAGETFTNTVSLPISSGAVVNDFIVKYNSSGIAISCMSMGVNNQPNKSHAVAIDSNDNVYFGGTYSATGSYVIKDMDTVGGTTSTNSVTFSSISSPGSFILKMNNSGVIQTGCKVFTYNNADGALQEMQFDSNDNLWVIGHVGLVSTTLTLNNFSTSGGSASAVSIGTQSLHCPFIIKYTADVPVLCARVIQTVSLGGSGVHNAFSMAIDSADNIYCSWRDRSNSTSFFQDMTTGGGSASSVVSPNTSSNFSTILVKYNSSGVVQGATYIDNAVQEQSYYSIAIDDSDNVYVGGRYLQGSTYTVRNIDATSSASSVTLPGQSGQKGFMVKYNSSGVAQNSSAFTHSAGDSKVSAVNIDSGGAIHAMGTKNNSTTALSIYDFDTVGGTGIDLTYTTSTMCTVFMKFSSGGVVETGGYFTNNSEPTYSGGSLPAHRLVFDGSKMYAVGAATLLGNFYDYDSSGGTVTNVDLGAVWPTAAMFVEINPGAATSSDTYKLISNLATGDAGLVKTFSNNDANTKTLNIRNAADDATLNSVAFTETAQFVWNGTAWKKLFAT
jgi:hypothetical protein